MVQTTQARDISLYELEEKFGLELITKADFFTEWVESLPALTDRAIAMTYNTYVLTIF